MNKKTFLRSVRSDFVYPDLYTQPDQSLTIGEIIERHVDAGTVSNHESEAYEDTNIDNPMRYDMEITDVPTVYQDGEHFDTLESMRRSYVDAALDPNPNNQPSKPVANENSKESAPSAS